MDEVHARVLLEFTEACQAAFGQDLASVVLFGSAAEDRLRASSDVNVIVVLKAFDPAKGDVLREPLRVAEAVVRLRPMFLLESEIPDAAAAFAVKFADILRRHQVLHGSDPFASLKVPRPAAIARLRQVLLNLLLRLREQYLSQSLREERLAVVVAEAAGPFRACAAELLDLEGAPAGSSKEALERVAGPAGGILANLSAAREGRPLPPGAAGPAVIGLIDLARAMRDRTGRLS